MLYSVIIASIFSFMFQPVPGQADYKEQINKIYWNITVEFKSKTSGLYIETTDTAHNKNLYSYLWPLCAVMQAFNEMEALEPQKDYLSPLLKTLEYYYRSDPPLPGYQAYVTSSRRDTRYYDDNQWIGIAALDAYNRNHKKEYLELAKTNYLFMMTGYDTVSGGGIYWREEDKTTKNTCSNGPGILMALQLYRITGNKEYLTTATNLYKWVNRYLLSPEGIYYDALKVKTMKIDSARYSYNTGTMLQANVLFYLINGDRSFLIEAQRIARAAKDYFYKNNKLPDNYWFNAVLLRGFTELCRADGNFDRLKFFYDDAERIWSTQKDASGLIGKRQVKRLIDQAAMLEIFARLQQVNMRTKGSTLMAQDQEKPLYLDTLQPFEKRTRDLISRLTPEEKATLLDHKAPDLVRFNILSDKWNQCLHGVWWTKPTTMFPIPTAMGATWDPDLIHQVATVISDEARAIYNGWHTDPNFDGEKKGLIYRSPVINISRNPYWGRINEIYSEDPYLTGRMGVAFVKGLQGDDPKYLKLVSTLKHFAVNNVEKDRQKLSATVSERMLFEYWLPHFRDCIIEGKAQSVMASYNAINGTPNNINKYLLTDILKNQWGFEGFVVSDLGGVKTMVQGHEKGEMSYEEAVAKSLIAGCDFSDAEYRTNIPKAVQMGILPVERLDDAVYRVMHDRFRLGEFDPPEMVPYSRIPMSVICSPEHRQLSLLVAQKSIVLLKNKDKLLPLNKNKIKKIAVIGPHADMFTAGGYSGIAIEPVTPLQGIKNNIAAGTEVLYTAGAEITPGKSTDKPFNREGEIKKAVDLATKADVVILYVGTTLAVEAEGRDRTTLVLPGNQQELVESVFVANPNTVVVEMNAGPLAVPWIKEKIPAIIEAWWAGEEGGNAIADVLFGNVNPGGKLPLTVYASDSQVPPQDEYDISKGFTYMYLNRKPLFPFGHGLSYTEFKYSGMKISSETIKPDGQITVSLYVTNSGKVEGDEIVQLYIHDVKCTVKRPLKELRGFKRIILKSGETKEVNFIISGEKLSFYDEKSHKFVVEPGEFEVLVGSSSEDIRLKGKFNAVR